MVTMSLHAGKFSKILPQELILSSPESLRPYECDGLSAYRCLPDCVLLPDCTEQVQAILAICHREKIPVIARGAGTGLSGGALPMSGAIILSLTRFNRILEIDPVQKYARVEPGVRNLVVSEAVTQHGLFYAPDPSSQIACTIGGNVAENSGGVHCLKYGLTVHNITSMKIVTIEGELVTLGSTALDAPGYDLLALMTGSEGMLGVVVEVTLKLLAKPVYRKILLAAFSSVEDAGNAVAGIIADGIIPAGLEMMDNAGIRAVEDFIHAGYPTDADAILLIELDGIEAEVEEQTRQVEKLLQQHRATETRIARDEEEGAKFWAGRKAAFPAVGRIAPDYYCMDGTIPRKQLATVLRTISELAREHGLGVANVFHAGDGNLHPLILYDAAKPGDLEKAELFGARILETCVACGGTITGEHGVGIEKINQMCVQFNTHELNQFHAIKSAFDSLGLLNPGKAVPTLKRCAELGGMHVHAGQIPHPELERF